MNRSVPVSQFLLELGMRHVPLGRDQNIDIFQNHRLTGDRGLKIGSVCTCAEKTNLRGHFHAEFIDHPVPMIPDIRLNKLTGNDSTHAQTYPTTGPGELFG